MARALELAARGQGFVEPNPMVGCVIVRDGSIVGEGWHQPLRRLACGSRRPRICRLSRPKARPSMSRWSPVATTAKRPPAPTRSLAPESPASSALSKILSKRSAAAASPCFDQQALSSTSKSVKPKRDASTQPYLKLISTGRPWIIAKWAMTLDGKIATRTGDSRWISSPASRELVHTIRGRVDGIMVGRGTVEKDDPLLTARPPGPRVATRIIVDSKASLSSDSQLVRTARQAPVLIAATAAASPINIDRLTTAGCEVLPLPLGKGRVCQDSTWRGESAVTHQATVSIPALLAELGRRRMTNILVEGGSQLLGSLFDVRAIDEVHIFIASILAGGSAAPSPIAGEGVDKIASAVNFGEFHVHHSGTDIHLYGIVNRTT